MVDLKEISVGVELETIRRDRGTVARAIQSVVGGEVTHVGGSGSFDPWTVVDSKGRTWQVVADSSLTSVPHELRAEVVSPILRFDDIPEFQEVVRAIRRCGAACDELTGLHVHVSHPDVTAKALANFAKIIYKQQEIIYAALGVNEHRMSRYCKPIDPAFIERIAKHPPENFHELNKAWYGRYEANPQRYSATRYGILNLNGWFVRGAVEIRAYAGSLHAGKVRAAILLSMALLARAMNCRAASAKKRVYDPASARYDMRVFMISALKMNGRTFRTARKHLLSNLPGDSAFKYGKAGRKRAIKMEAGNETH